MDTIPPRILTVDDDSVTLRILAIGMRNAGYQITQAASAEDALNLLAESTPDLALLDISLPGMSGIDLAKYLREETNIPFMFLSSLDDLDTIRQATANGAIGYMVKPIDITQIIPAVEAGLARAAEIRQLQQIKNELMTSLAAKREAMASLRDAHDAQELLLAQHSAMLSRASMKLDQAQEDMVDMQARERQLSKMANEDSLTMLPNRNWLISYLPKALARAEQMNAMLALLFIDLDGFKTINDNFGHAVGDALLRSAAARLKSVLRVNSSIVRIGGDEFVVIVEQVADEADAAHVAERMIEVLKNPFELSHGHSQIGASVGISMFPRDGADVESLLRNSDIAMYQAKVVGKGQYRFYQPALSGEQAANPLQSAAASEKHQPFALVYRTRTCGFSGECIYQK